MRTCVINVVDQGSEYKSKMRPGICRDKSNIMVFNIVWCLAKGDNFIYVVQDGRSVLEIVKWVVYETW
jgi:hypothetical protein